MYTGDYELEDIKSIIQDRLNNAFGVLFDVKVFISEEQDSTFNFIIFVNDNFQAFALMNIVKELDKDFSEALCNFRSVSIKLKVGDL